MSTPNFLPGEEDAQRRQRLLRRSVGLGAGAGEGVQMDALGQGAQGLGVRAGAAGQKRVHIRAACQLQRPRQLP